MPPFNDIYVVTDDRSESCISKFLSNYADLAVDKQRNDFNVLTDGENVEIGTLDSAISYGLSDVRKSFTIYFSSKIKDLKSIILFFTPDGRLVLGLSTEYSLNSSEESERVLVMLKTEFGTDIGVITCETPPGDAYDWINENIGQF